MCRTKGGLIGIMGFLEIDERIVIILKGYIECPDVEIGKGRGVGIRAKNTFALFERLHVALHRFFVFTHPVVNDAQIVVGLREIQIVLVLDGAVPDVESLQGVFQCFLDAVL